MGERQPFLSIVVPTYRRPGPLAQCLEALAELDYPRDRFEVLVVDDGSGDPPRDAVERRRDRLDVALIEMPRNGGPAGARNAGAARARGDLIAFTDDDCAPAPDWLGVLAARHAAAPDQAIGGYTVNLLTENPYSSASQLLIDYLYQYYNREEGLASFFASNNLAIPAQLFRQVGGFDTSFPLAAAEDRELCDRWCELGHRMTYAPEAIVYHRHEMSLPRFWRQHANYGRGAFHFKQLREERGWGAIGFEPFSFYRDMLLYPFRRGSGPSAWHQCARIVLSQIANAIGFFAQRRSAV